MICSASFGGPDGAIPQSGEQICHSPWRTILSLNPRVPPTLQHSNTPRTAHEPAYRPLVGLRSKTSLNTYGRLPTTPQSSFVVGHGTIAGQSRCEIIRRKHQTGGTKRNRFLCAGRRRDNSCKSSRRSSGNKFPSLYSRCSSSDRVR